MATVYKDIETGRITKTPPKKRARGKAVHKGNESGLSTKAKKQAFLDLVRSGLGSTRAVEELQISAAALAYWRKTDEQFKADHERVKLIKSAPGIARQNMPSFEEFCDKYLDTKLFKHHLQWIDLLEGREPRDLHPNQVYVPGEPETVLINTPPEHAKALALDTEVLTPFGFSTIGDLWVGSKVYGPDGKTTSVVGKSEVFLKDTSEVSLSGGENFVASDDHLWTIERDHKEITVRTVELLPGDKLPKVDPLEFSSRDYILDPYLLGVWLGDGHTDSGRFTTADMEIVDAFKEFDPVPYVKYGYETHGLYALLAELGLIGRKFVPEGYLLGDIDQRLSLLQGLMDSDGTISSRGQASFTNKNSDLARGVQYLAASLGLRPTIKKFMSRLGDKECGWAWVVTFSPNGLPVFRLPRKLKNVRPIVGRVGGPRLRSIVSVSPIDTVPTQCIKVDNESHLFLIGRGLVPTHNSTTITMNYVTYRICEDPNIRIIIVSKTQEMAKKFLRGIKDRLAGTGGTYRQLQIDFAPEGGFDGNSSAWTADSIYVSGDLRDSGEKDPTVQALGIRGHIYGSRADLIIMDDCVDMGNAHEYAKHIDWIQNQVLNRLSYPGGRLLLVGTRLQPVDLYSEILKDEYYGEEKSPWTYLTQPAVLEFADKTADWVTLWPWTNRPPVSLQARKLVQQNEYGLYPMWSGLALSKRRAGMSPRNWAMVYQQEQVVEDAIFSVKNVTGCVDGTRAAGPMVRGAPGHRDAGMDGISVIGGFDPAITGNSAAVILGVDRNTGVRWVLDVWTRGHCKPDDIFDKIKELTVKYHVSEWRIEKNAMNLMVTQNREIRNFLASRGCLLKEHFTGKNKWDADFGVASMSMMFEGWEQKKNLIRLPSRSSGEGIKAFIEQLTTWFPETKGKTDTVMALWFAEIRARELVNELESVFHMDNPYRSGRDDNKIVTVDLDYASQAAFAGHVTGEWWS